MSEATPRIRWPETVQHEKVPVGHTETLAGGTPQRGWETHDTDLGDWSWSAWAGKLRAGGRAASKQDALAAIERFGNAQ